MSSQTIDLDARIKCLKAVLPKKADQEAVEAAFKAADGDREAARTSLEKEKKFSNDLLPNLDLADSLADWCGDNVAIVKALAPREDVQSLRDVAAQFNADNLAELVKPQDVPEATPGESPEDKVKNYAAGLEQKLFDKESTAVIQLMVREGKIPVANAGVREGVITFLKNNADFSIRRSPIYQTLRDPKAFEGIPEEHRGDIEKVITTAKRVRAISPTSRAVAELMNTRVASAFQVADMPESAFIAAYSKSFGEETARQVYTNAINTRIRNEHLLISMREALRGTGLAIIDGTQTMEERIAWVKEKFRDDLPQNWESWFGSMDYCECDECHSVYSPAAYFVELLQYLRSNNLDPKNPNTGKAGYANTPLEKLFRRRPDLGCLELTCENAFTVLPYVDLVNEVMESFVVHQGEYHASSNNPSERQASLEVFNVEDETTGELLAQPQHINDQAYCTLKHAVYPFTLPYHQPIDAIRIFLNYLGTSRHELLDTFRPAKATALMPFSDCAGNASQSRSASHDDRLGALNQLVIDRAVDAEFLGMSQEEYIILTREAFWPKKYFEITQDTDLSQKDYRDKTGVKDVHKYYGYSTQDNMLSLDEQEEKGLAFVKKQFLPRTGIQYTDLVELLKTEYINPGFLRGKALKILESIRFSYRFLQTLVDQHNPNPQVRYRRLIEFLEIHQPLIPLLDAMIHPDPCSGDRPDWCLERDDLRTWVYCYFERVGKLNVLELGEHPQLPIEGDLATDDAASAVVGTLNKDGTIVDDNDAVIGMVTIDGQVTGKDGKPFVERFGNRSLWVRDSKGTAVGFVNAKGLWRPNEKPVQWLPAHDTCDLTKVRLRHLDGTPLTVDECDRIQRFIRLWRKMGWTIDETDKALAGLGKLLPGGGGTSACGDDSQHVGFDAFQDDCSRADAGLICPDPPKVPREITPEFLHQLVAVKKLLDRTGLPLIKLLTFWADISTSGEKSLYASLFLTHNMLGIDKVFQADAHGYYLTGDTKISDHIPVLMAALGLKADDIREILEFSGLSGHSDLNIQNVSTLYRNGLLAKLLHVRVEQLPDVTKLFGLKQFERAADALSLLEIWQKMEDVGFTFAQLNYVIYDKDDKLRPLAPSDRTILQVTKALYDGLNAIDRDHPDAKEDEGRPREAQKQSNKKELKTEDRRPEPTAEVIRAKAALIFDQSIVEQIVGLLEGTTVYPCPAPANPDLDVKKAPALEKKLKYNSPKDGGPLGASIQVTGILTEKEKELAKGLSANPRWSKAIDRAGRQPQIFFKDVLSGIFPDPEAVEEARKLLLSGDENPPPEEWGPEVRGDPTTAPKKRLHFLKHFMPFLRKQLTRRLIADTMAGAVSLTGAITKMLLSDILKVGTPLRPAMEVLEDIKFKHEGGTKGYLIPAIDEEYTFMTPTDDSSHPPAPLWIDDFRVEFEKWEEEDPNFVWSTQPQALQGGRGYKFDADNLILAQLQWKTRLSPRTAIPESALLPDYSSQETELVFRRLHKCALLINGFNLTVDEVSYFVKSEADSDKFDFNPVSLKEWRRLQTYTTLRGTLPQPRMALLDLFQWANRPDDRAKPEDLSSKIEDATGWKKEAIEKLLSADLFDLDRKAAFRNEVALSQMAKAMKVADKVGHDIGGLFRWAYPGSKFWLCHEIAQGIRNAARARYDQESWEQVVKPLNDQLREHQKQALISYLIVQQDLIDWGVVDADSLFEFFLIDVQMDPCMETSRIKQATSTVQLFIQRCMLGLEERKHPDGRELGVSVDALDRKRWDWMQRYRVWEANRKIFLYPENWIRSELRDDKSPFYKELESELLQKDINPQTVQDALKGYLFKVDEVANLKVVGLFLDETEHKLHVFARTRNAPYFFYYRYFHTEESNWYPWEKMQVDIPTYEQYNEKGHVTGSGTYLIPVVWNKRLLVFFPQFAKKTETLGQDSFTVNTAGDRYEEGPHKNELNGNTTTSIPINRPYEFWEIKMAWTEYRNGKWTQKQVSTAAIYHPADPWPRGFPLSTNKFVPRIVSRPEPGIVIDIYQVESSSIGAFHFAGSQFFEGGIRPDQKWDVDTNFHYTLGFFGSPRIYSLQAKGSDSPSLFKSKLCFEDSETNTAETKTIFHIKDKQLDFFHPFAHDLLGKLVDRDLNDLFKYFGETGSSTMDNAYGKDYKTGCHELRRPYALYNWEAAFHAPMLLADRMMKSQQFEQALKMCQYVFNPLAKGSGKERVWQFPPFKEIDAERVLDSLFAKLQPGQEDTEVAEWRNNPFQPHRIARSRPSAYMKWVVMKYIEILIAFGDYYFRQNTLETVPLAIQCYVLASHIYGPGGQKIPKRGKIRPQTYLSLLDRWDAFSNAMVELELLFPTSNQTELPLGLSDATMGLPNIFGYVSTLYFCIPDNPQLTALRDTIDDRLFKIHHCQDIEGVFRKLPLFERQIEPGLLVQAAAAGLSIGAVLNDLNSPMPNYRFQHLLQKALELCSEVKALGNAFLSAMEKKEAEALSRLRATHESSIHNLVMEVRKQQLEEAGRSLEALQQSRKGPAYRLQHYLKLIGEDLGKVPDGNTEFGELPDQVEQPVDESGLKLIQYEKEELDKAAEAASEQKGIGEVETLANIMHAVPDITIMTAFWGIGAETGLSIGTKLGNAAQAIARRMRIQADHLSYQSSSAGRKGGFQRQIQDRVQQANIAGYEIKNIDKQILTQQIRMSIAQQEITNQQKQIDNAQEVEEYLRSKYTNEELYSWMEGSVRTLYYQAYTMAYDMAKKAEKVFRFERGLTTSNFIQFGYWDTAHDGLLAGEKLYVGLKQLEAAYQEKRGYDYEITKPVSLRQVNPIALLKLRESGTCEFALPEVIFDMDHPGHYMRRIKSVALTIPCVVGPYTSLNCTLRLLGHKFRTSGIAANKTDYLEKTDQTDERFSTVNVPITSIAVSTGQNDSGVFELNFRDERYIPFEGAGVVSTWRLELPTEFRQFDYDSISDVIMHVRYTAVEGGDKLKGSAAGSVDDYIKAVRDLTQEEGLVAAFDLRHDFPNEWHKAMHPPAGTTERVLMLTNLADRLPFFTKNWKDKLQVTDIYLLSDTALGEPTLIVDNDELNFQSDGLEVKPMTVVSIKGQGISVARDSWKLRIPDTSMEKVWLLIRYKLP